MDILIFSGQSNMQGSTGTFPKTNPVYELAKEYKYLSDEIVDLKHPSGEDIGDNLIAGAALNNGSILPYLAQEYSKLTNRKTLSIHVAKGATIIEEWLKGTPRYELLIKKVKAGIEKIKKIESIDKIFFIWLQGESDALEKTSKDNYKKMLLELNASLKEELNIDKFCIIEVGYFASEAPWDNLHTKETRDADEAIMNAQIEIAEENPDFYMLSTKCPILSRDSKYLNEKECGPHYNNEGMEIIGKDSAYILSKLVN